MTETHPGFRIFILGAGFSRPAGLPLGSELFAQVHRQIEHQYGRDTKFQRDVENYLEYRRSCDGIELQETTIDLEDLISFLDIEHFLRLRGSDTWSEEGNESQLMIRKAIGKVLHARTPSADSLPDVYYSFAEHLSLNDIVITFNYDILLERALEHIGKPYRLFPLRFKHIGRSSSEVDSSVKEVTILKLHGSVDWFDDRNYLEFKEQLMKSGGGNRAIHTVFDDPKRYQLEPLVQGLYPPDDPLLHIQRIRDVDSYYRQDRGFNAPFILSPSHVKFVYATRLLGLWDSLGRAGGYNLGISIIGFSLPRHDEYIRVGLYQMISNYQQSWWDSKLLDVLKDKVRLVDYRNSADSIAEYKQRYSFVDPSRAEFMFDGLSAEAIDFLFNHPRET